jgi:hypothetical protein
MKRSIDFSKTAGDGGECDCGAKLSPIWQEVFERWIINKHCDKCFELYFPMRNKK